MTYGEIMAEVRDTYLHRSTAATLIRSAIRLVHRDIQRPLKDALGRELHSGNWRCMEAHKDDIAYTTADVDGVAVPADYKSARSVWLVGDDDSLTPVDPASDDLVRRMKSDCFGTTGRVLGTADTVQAWYELEMKLCLLFPADVTVRLDYYKWLTLSTVAATFDAATDWFSTNIPDVLILGACALGSQGLWQDGRAGDFAKQYMTQRASAAAEDVRSKRGAMNRAYDPPSPAALRRLG